MRLISFDTETELIARGRQVPPLVVISYAELDLSSREPRILSKGLVSHTDALAWLIPLLENQEVHFTGANIAYDVLVTSALWPNPDPDGPSYDEEILARWVAAYDADRVTDLLTRQKLLDLAAGCYRREQLSDGRWAHHKYNLASLAWRLCRMRLDKGDPKKGVSTKLTAAEQAQVAAQIAQDRAKASAGTEETDTTDEQENSWRLRYAELKDIPIERWPHEARQYALDDAVAGALVWHAQESGRPRVKPLITPVPQHKLTDSLSTLAASTVTEPGYNIWSGSTDGSGLAAALTNPTEIAKYKKTIAQSYPFIYRGKTWADLEAAWFELSLTTPNTAEQDALMADMICSKFEQHPRLFAAVQRRGGAEWLKRCSHFTEAKSTHMQAWEGYGEGSRFIRNLIAGYVKRSAQLTDSLPVAEQPVKRIQSDLDGLDASSYQGTRKPSTVEAANQVSSAAGPAGALWSKIRENFGPQADPFKDQYRQTRGALWLRAMSAHGLRTDPPAVERFASYIQHKHSEVTTRLVDAGLVRTEWHLDKEALGKWVAERCVEINAPQLGTKKAELLELANLLGAEDPNCEVAVIASSWLQIIKALRGPKPEPQSLEEAPYALAKVRYAKLEEHKLAYRTFHRDTKAAAHRMHLACNLLGVNVPRTESYDPKRHTELECIALDKEACHSVQGQGVDLTPSEASTLAEAQSSLTDYAEVSHLGKILSADIPVLRSGTTAPIHTRFEELLETGRTGSSGPNVQNRARGNKCDVCKGGPNKKGCTRCLGSGAELGDRECYIPRAFMYDTLEGKLVRSVLVDSDYSLGELHTLAQACLWLFGTSDLANVLKIGRDPHTAMACIILGISYEEGVKRKKAKDPEFDNARNCAKAVNFGKPGGLGIETMRAYAIRSYGVDLPARCNCEVKTGPNACKCITWEKILALWERLWTEMPKYFAWVDEQKGKKGRPVVDKAGHRKVEQLYNIVQPWSERLRAGATYCSACNSIYQGLLADVLKRAGWYLFKACYLSVETMLKYGLKLAETVGVAGQARLALTESAALYGCRPINEIHDQFLIEAPETRGDAAAKATALLMNRAGAEILPDVPVKCEPILAMRWSKRAEEIKVDGKLVAWEDERLRAERLVKNSVADGLE